jgi:hypothetical protein
VEKYGEARGAVNDVTIWCIRVACWISKATCTRIYTLTRPGTRTKARANTHCVIFIAFSTATIIRERASVLLYTCIVCLVYFTFLFLRFLFNLPAS